VGFRPAIQVGSGVDRPAGRPHRPITRGAGRCRHRRCRDSERRGRERQP